MNIVKIGTNNQREGILTYKDGILTVITDQDIKAKDIMLSPLYSHVVGENVSTMVVEVVEEERPSKGTWNSAPPPIWRRIKFKKEQVPGKVIKEAGYLKTELVQENGKQVQKSSLIF